uniref:Glutathione peroxidase n=1 Tax=Neobodo designis TaxID=312471 RepID=A0A7S1Q7H6_NEODS|mmetsp:Transcript_33260/g.102696  ORF Transcript_33260/g.102696 Transcript_33260/m.102696 type:complete len:236 (+) Transcript_33260:57-764(+)|eukprot:CAMPEP_0174852140 /NCGR_PEP_ID=MMETSP1114-20130205/25210_1 /TAXON_ID=312471 /ORGANISM="Neobodo designis, Strain CCAP 1951/1" /LENGTH=235 /DNA_ID=CAMNT_0016086719 /DNA_START=51 /DNA_END=758 /DNA_ORIENTATION=-
MPTANDKHAAATKAGAKPETKLNFATDENVKHEKAVRAADRKASAGKNKFKASDKAQLTRGTAAQSLEGLEGSSASSIHEFKHTYNEGKDTFDFATTKGKYVLIVNIASKCGKTEGGYKMMRDVDGLLRSKGVEVIAVPCNQFGKQEPGTYAEICAFAKKQHKTDIRILDKADVNGDGALPLYNFLKAKTNGKRIEWNFVAFLCDPDGHVVQRFSAGPTYEAVEKAIAAARQSKA